MFDDISATGWLVILCALALGFGVIKFLIVAVEDRSLGLPPDATRARQADSVASTEGAGPTQRESFNDVRPHTSNAQGDGLGSLGQEAKPWHEVLGVPVDAPWEQVTESYRKKMTQYHPEKLAGLGPEFTSLAEKMTKELNVAYEKARVLKA